MSPLRDRGGFTLVEILVAMAVLALLGLIFVELTSMTSSAIHFSNQSIDASSQAYLSFDRLRMDLAALVERPDVDFISQNPTTVVGGGNVLLFLANVGSAGIPPSATGLAANRDVSMVAYQISDDADNGGRPCLLRAGKALTWTNTGFLGLATSGTALGLPISFNDGNFPAALLPSAGANPSDFDVLAPGIIRMVIGYQLYPDNLPAALSNGVWVAGTGWGVSSTVPNAQGQVVYSPPLRSVTPLAGGLPQNYIDVKRIASVVVGVIALDVNSAKLATPSQLATLAGDFPLPADGVLPLKSWTSLADSLGSSPSSIALPIRQAVRVFQQTFPLTPYGMKGD